MLHVCDLTECLCGLVGFEGITQNYHIGTAVGCKPISD